MILFAPHNDDEALFASYTIMRHKPLVVVVYDSYVQDWCTKEERRKETEQAMELLGAKVIFLGLDDRECDYKKTKKEMTGFSSDVIFAPSGSHKHHELVGRIAKELWNNPIIYTTYNGNEYLVKGSITITPTEEEKELKNKALDCYKTQLGKNAPHFEAVRNQPEYYE